MEEWLKVKGKVGKGYGVASGQAKNSPYPAGTISMQTPYFQALGLDLSQFFPGTLNISIAPYRFKIKQTNYTFRQVQWGLDIPAEDFSFSPISLEYQDKIYQGWLYYPHPETKPAHFQDDSTIELIAPRIEGISYGDEVMVSLKASEISLSISNRHIG